MHSKLYKYAIYNEIPRKTLKTIYFKTTSCFVSLSNKYMRSKGHNFHDLFDVFYNMHNSKSLI